MNIFDFLLNIAKRLISFLTRLTTLETDVDNLETRMDEAIEIHQVQVNLPSAINVSANGLYYLMQDVDIRTLPYNALDDISGMTKTLVGAVFLWTNRSYGIATDLLVSDGKLSVRCYFMASGTVNAVRLLTFWT